jgi:hypothetical protein
MKALVKKDNKKIGEIPLTYSGNPSLFFASLDARKSGNYELIVYAYHPVTGNTGVDRVSFLVR